MENVDHYDRLSGTWTAGADDGSGLRTMIYNYGLTLNENGTGSTFSWSKENKKYEEEIFEIEWKVLGENKIKIRYTEERIDSDKWEVVEYEISDFTGPYNAKYFKLVDKGKELFWEFPEPIYKEKYERKESGIFYRLWNSLFG